MFSKHKTNTVLIQEPERTNHARTKRSVLLVTLWKLCLEDIVFLRKEQAGILWTWTKTLGCIFPLKTWSGQYLGPWIVIGGLLGYLIEGRHLLWCWWRRYALPMSWAPPYKASCRHTGCTIICSQLCRATCILDVESTLRTLWREKGRSRLYFTEKKMEAQRDGVSPRFC